MSHAEFAPGGASYFLHPASGRTWTIALSTGRIHLTEGQIEETASAPKILDLGDVSEAELLARYEKLVEAKEDAGYIELASEKDFFPKTVPRLRKQLTEAGLARPVWLPETEEAEVADWGNGSYYGGGSWYENQPWPVCKGCSQPLTQLLQIDLGQLPAGLDGLPSEGLVKLYLCNRSCSTQMPGLNAQEGFYHFVYVPAADKSRLTGRSEGADLALQLITGWEPVRAELPDVREKVSEKTALGLTETEQYVWLQHLAPRTGDKLGGRPHWLRDAATPECRDCQQSLSMLYQIDGETRHGLSLGEEGLGHVWLCAEHPEHVIFTWQEESV